MTSNTRTRLWIVASRGLVNGADGLLRILAEFPTRAIAKYQWGVPYTHVGLTPNPFAENVLAWHAAGGGVGFDSWDNRDYDLFFVPCQVWQKQKVYDFLNRQLGKKYDYLGLLAFLWRKNEWQNPDKWFCSELLLAAMQEARVYGVNPNIVKPHQGSPRVLLACCRGPVSLHTANLIEGRE